MANRQPPKNPLISVSPSSQPSENPIVSTSPTRSPTDSPNKTSSKAPILPPTAGPTSPPTPPVLACTVNGNGSPNCPDQKPICCWNGSNLACMSETAACKPRMASDNACRNTQVVGGLDSLVNLLPIRSVANAGLEETSRQLETQVIVGCAQGASAEQPSTKRKKNNVHVIM